MTVQTSSKVFIVDDSAVVRERLVQLISELPAVQVVGTADLAFDAVRSIRKLRPDAVILDISMPGGNGIFVLESVKSQKPAPLVIMLTNFAHDQYRQQCFKLGADYFFDKSTEFEKIQEVLKEVKPLPPGPPSSSTTFFMAKPS